MNAHDVLTQIDTLLAFRNTAPQDRKALREWVEHHAAEGDCEQCMQSFPSLPTGEGWIWSPEFLGSFERIKVCARATSSSSDGANSASNLAMDRQNLDILQRRAPAGLRDRIRLFLEFAPDADATEVPDPYYGGVNGFEEVLDLVEAAARGLLEHVRAESRRA